MRKTIKTEIYTFTINLKEEKNNCFFEIVAICNADKTKSSITNLNFIISELIEPIIEFDDYESTIQTNNMKGNELYNLAIELFNNVEWLEELYYQLEDDKREGMWT